MTHIVSTVGRRLLTPVNSLVSTYWLSDVLKATRAGAISGLKLIDVSGGRTVGYIPGSQQFQVGYVQKPDSHLSAALPTSQQFSNYVNSLDIHRDNAVVIVDGPNGIDGPRIWWLFRYFGHDNVAVLDGGVRRWWIEGRKLVDIEDAHVADTDTDEEDFRAVPQSPWLYKLDELAKDIRGENPSQILDSRPPRRFYGHSPEPYEDVFAGHIRGSKNLYFRQLLDSETGKFLPAETLGDLFSSVDINILDAGQKVVGSCGSGISACYLSLAAQQCTPHLSPRLPVYYGSWQEAALDGGDRLALWLPEQQPEKL